MLQVVPQTDEERLEMYRRNCTYDELAEMHLSLKKCFSSSQRGGLSDEKILEFYRRDYTFDELAKLHISLEKTLSQSAGVYEDVEVFKKSGIRQCQFAIGDLRCSAEADYKIVFEEAHENKPEDSVDTCLEHIYAMLSDAVEHKLVKISLRKVG